MSYYFLPSDYAKLQRAIEEAHRRVRHHGREMGLACQEGAETFHDNFAYEDAERRFTMWSRRLRKLIDVREGAYVVEPADTGDRVALGRTVTLLDLETMERRTVRIGSYMTFDDDGETVSYASPLARSLIGAYEGELRSATIAGEPRSLKVAEVA